MKSRVRRLEQKARGRREPLCPECNGRIIFVDIKKDGTTTYSPDPCEVCGSRGSAASGRIGRIIVDMRDPEDKTEEEDVFTFELDKPGHETESEVTEWP